jgi:hypothetical protein
MANPLTFLLPLRYNAMGTILVVQSGPIELAVQVVPRLRALFPGCKVEGLIRDNDLPAVSDGHFDRVIPVRWEDRVQVVRQLRERRFDGVAVLLSSSGSRAFRLLPYLLRTNAILMFNDHLDYFPLKLARLSSLAQHVSGSGSVGALVRWTLGRALVRPAATVLLLASTARIQLRAARRRRGRRARGAQIAGSA